MDDRIDERRLLAEASRRVIRATRVTEASVEELEAAVALLDEAADVLERAAHAGPHCQIGWGPNVYPPGAQPAELFPFSPASGPLNPVAPEIDLTIAEDRSVTGVLHLTEQYNGPPWDLGHGGVVALVFDELLGLAGIAAAGGGFTGKLTVRYRKPTPILADIDLRAWMEQADGRRLVAHGEMRHEGLLLAEAEGLFIKLEGPLRAEEDRTAARDAAG